MRLIRCLFKRKKKDDGIRFINLEETESTNQYCLHSVNEAVQYPGESIRMVVVGSEFQSAGRGQGSNKWESRAGANLLFSILLHPEWIPVRMQFVISKCIALAVRDALACYAEDMTVKWPNDIYYKDKKICGILIENRIVGGHIKDCVVGVGINVNQLQFHSDAPNPISLRQIVGHEIDREALLKDVVNRFDELLIATQSTHYAGIASAYASSLYRAQGFHRYKDRDGMFEASILEVEDDGRLVLRDRCGMIREYCFKEVEHVI